MKPYAIFCLTLAEMIINLSCNGELKRSIIPATNNKSIVQTSSVVNASEDNILQNNSIGMMKVCEWMDESKSPQVLYEVRNAS